MLERLVMFFLVYSFDREIGLLSEEVMRALDLLKLFRQVEPLFAFFHFEVEEAVRFAGPGNGANIHFR